MNALAALSLAIWIGLIARRFWTCAERDDTVRWAAPAVWPEVVAVIPARDEADVIARTLNSVAVQDYAGPFRIVLVDDNSADGTGAVARRLAGGLGLARVRVLSGAPLPPGWMGKLWALQQGIDAAGDAPWLWLTDADIEHAPDTLTRLVGIAHGDPTQPRALVSFMALLHCRTWAERALIPAFIYFFMLLYPFGRINAGRQAGAAGGCVLVNAAALRAGGGVAAMRRALIDDCTLGALIAGTGGRIWLGLTRRCRSVRAYAGAGEIGAMIARSAYAQLRFNPALLVGTIVGLSLVFGAGPVVLIAGHGWARGTAALSCALMAGSMLPILSFYRRSPLWALTLPVVAGFYAGCTLLSALAHYAGRGGLWKGRVAPAAAP